MRHETKKRWGDKTQDKKMGDEMQDGKKWGDKTQDKKNGEMRCETKKMGSRDWSLRHWDIQI